MSVNTCPNGHVTESSDYCDTCGTPMGLAPAPVGSIPSRSRPAPATPAPPAATPAAGSSADDEGAARFASPSPPSATVTPQPCPSCAMANTADALFCEACGYDFTTGTMPRPPSPTDLPNLVGALAAATGPYSGSPSTAPAIEAEWVAEVWVDPDWYAEQDSDELCPSPGLPAVVPLLAQSLLIGRRSKSRSIHPEIECASDVGVSRRQAQLTTDGRRWWVEDLQSSNGTYVGAASGPLPTGALPPGQRRELAEDDRIYLGAWTRIVVRRATPEEQLGIA